MDLHSRKSTFAFQPDADRIENQPLRFDRCVEFADRLSNDQLIQYIMAEFQNFRNERLEDVSTRTRGARFNAI